MHFIFSDVHGPVNRSGSQVKRMGCGAHVNIASESSHHSSYCKFGNFRVTFISRFFYFRIISEFLNSRVSVHVFYKVYSDSLLAKTLNSRGNQFANISENYVLANISGSTVIQFFTIQVCICLPDSAV